MPSVFLLRSSQYMGGIERQLLDYSRRLTEYGWNPLILCLYRSGGEHPLTAEASKWHIPALTIPDPSAWHPAPVMTLARLLKERRPDLVHTLDYRSDVMAAWLKGHLPLVIESHGHTRESRWMGLWNHLDRWAMRRADVVIAVSPAWETRLAADGVHPSKLRSIGNSRSVLSANHTTSGIVSLPPPGPHLLYAGRLAPEKGVEDLLLAWPAIRQRFPEIQLWITSPTTQGTYFRELDTLLAQPGIHHQGYAENVATWIQAADVVVVPSRQEAWGIVAFEAIAGNKPLVATRVGNLPHLCRQVPCTYLVEPASPQALVAGITKALDTPIQGQACGSKALSEGPRFDPDLRAKRLLEIYQALVGPDSFPQATS